MSGLAKDAWPAELWLLRHGESAGNVARRTAEASGAFELDIASRDVDVALSSLGVRQARAVGRWFRALPRAKRPSVVMASPYVRAVQTASMVVEHGELGSADLVHVVDERLREKEFGALERLTKAGIRERLPHEAEQRDRLGKFYYRPPGGESWCDVILRLRSVLHHIQLRHAGERVLVVAHEVIVLCFRYLLEEMSESQILRINEEVELANCSLTSYACVDEPKGPRMKLQRYNFVAPLEEAGTEVTKATDVAVGARLRRIVRRVTARFATPIVHHERRPDGGHVLRSGIPLPEGPPHVGVWLERHAATIPDRAFLRERAGDGLRSITYAEAFARVRAIARGLLDLGASPARPVLLLSENSIDHALTQLAAMHVGVPAVPISPAYSLVSSDGARLRAIAEVVHPAVVYAASRERFARAIDWLDGGARVLTSLDAIARPPDAEVDARAASVGPDTIAKVLFTSGSTGAPKGIVNTQRMLVSNQEAIAATWPFLADEPPVVVDWLPWSHTFGGNHNFFLVLRSGGTLLVNEGRPAPGAFEATLANLREVPPTLHFDVPRGFELLANALEADRAFAERFFARLELLFYAAAALPDATFQRLLRVSEKVTGRLVTLTSSWGQTETAPTATTAHFPLERAGNIGVPAPGCAIALAPVGEKLEIGVAGPNVTPGAWERGGTVRPIARDEHGFLRTGDAARLADPRDATRGIVFDGRLAENFKLATGTWVTVAEVRLAVIAHLAPFAQDAVIAGHDRDELGALIVPSAACATRSPDELERALRDGLERLLAASRGASTRVTRALVLTAPLSLDAGEITDKGYVNQRAVLRNRAAEVERLYAGGDGVIRPGS